MPETKKRTTKKKGSTSKATTEAKATEPLATEDDFNDLTNAPIYVEVRGQYFGVRALPMGDIPKLSRLVNAIGEMEIDKPITASPEQLELMARIIRIGIKEDHPKMTVDKILRSMPIGAFPDFLVAVLDTNDFFGKMQDYRKMAAGQPMNFGFPNISKELPDDSDL